VFPGMSHLLFYPDYCGGSFPKRLYARAERHGITSYTTAVLLLSAVETSDMTCTYSIDTDEIILIGCYRSDEEEHARFKAAGSGRPSSCSELTDGKFSSIIGMCVSEGVGQDSSCPDLLCLS
jgi:hypothetical protein